MMDFARALAPGADGERGRALPVLPSRMSGETPVRFASAPWSVDEDQREDPDAGSLPRVREPLQPGSAAARLVRSQPVADAGAVAGQVQTKPVSAAVDFAARRAPETPQRSDASAWRPPLRESRPTTAARPEPPDLLDRDRASPGQDVRQRKSVSPPRALASSPATPSIGAIANASQRAEPLSSPALAARIAPPAPGAVHVHIDRIDLRLPDAGPSRAAAPRQTTHRAGSVTLADYLQARARRGQGAAR